MMASLFGLLQAAATPAASGAPALTDFTARANDPMAQLFRFLFTTVPQEVQIAGVAIGGPIAVLVAWQAWKHRVRLWAWFNDRERHHKLIFTGVVALVAFAGLGAGAYGYNYMMHDNNFCQSCHIMDTAWNRFQTTKHKEQKCHDCHQQPLWVSTKEIYWWVLERRMAIPAHDKVPNARCVECHVTAKRDSVRTNILTSAGHALHYNSDSSSLKDLECSKCHGTDFHRFVPNNNTCAQAGCHQGKKIVLGKMTAATGLHCTMCHAFKDKSTTDVAGAAPRKLADVGPNQAAEDTAKRDMTPKQDQCESCHKMQVLLKDFKAANDPHKAVCGTCHNPHKQETPKETYQSCATAQCHASADTLTAMHRGLRNHALDDCGVCHKAHDWKVDGKNCLACHENIFERQPKLVKSMRKSAVVPPLPEKHRGLVRGMAWRAPSREVRRARRTRLIAAAWTPRPVEAPRRPTVRRFQQGTTSPAVVPAPAEPSDTLAFSHKRHKALTCNGCHTADKTHGYVKIKAPGDCQSCHHAADARAGKCATCHAPNELQRPYARSVTVNVSARKTGAVTRTLSFKHDLHGKLACAECHGTAITKTVQKTCNSCHADHHAPARDCATCHPTAKIGHERSIHEGCTSCHTDSRAAALVASRTMCLACHGAQRTHKERRECADCHAVHLAHDVKKEGTR